MLLGNIQPDRSRLIKPPAKWRDYWYDAGVVLVLVCLRVLDLSPPHGTSNIQDVALVIFPPLASDLSLA